MRYIGAHVSAAGGVENAPVNAYKIGATGFAMFTKNQKQWKAKPLKQENIHAFIENMTQYGYSPESVLPHDSYLINPCNPDPVKREKSIESLLHEVERCYQLGLIYLNIHPGSHLGKIKEEEAFDLVADTVNRVHRSSEGVVLVLENTAGQGNTIGHKFEHIAEIIDRIDDKSRIGVCYDTCHGFAAGYDIRPGKEGATVIERFDSVIDMDYLCGIHVNDAKSGLNSRKDRHDSLGKGNIGWEGFKTLMQDPRIDNIPVVLETVDPQLWPEEIAFLKQASGYRA